MKKNNNKKKPSPAVMPEIKAGDEDRKKDSKKEMRIPPLWLPTAMKAFFCALLGLCLAIPAVSMASKVSDATGSAKFDTTADNGGWTKDKIDEAHTVYSATEWDKVGGMVITTDGSVAVADVPDDFSKSYLEDMRAAIKDYTGDTAFTSTSYEQLFMAMAYVLYKKQQGITTNELPSSDFCAAKVYFDAGYENDDPITAKESAGFLIRAYFNAEDKTFALKDTDYYKTHDFDYSIGDNDSPLLQATIQAAIYGSSYVKNRKASDKISEDYYEDHKDEIGAKFNDFYTEVCKIYDPTPLEDDHQTKG